MGLTARIWQVDEGAGSAWRAPAGAQVEDFPEDDLEDGKLELDQAWQDIGECLEQFGVKAPWADGEEELEGSAVNRLAGKLWPLTWAEMVRRGLDLKGLGEAEYLESYYELFRHFVLDAARGGNGLAWEID